MKNRGFTLIEMLVALGIFGVLIVAIMRVFTSGFSSQRQILEMQAVQRDGAYIMEILSRDIRMAQNWSDLSSPGSDSSVLVFYNHSAPTKEVTYCRANDIGECSSTGDNFAMKTEDEAEFNVLNSSDVRVTDLHFFVLGQNWLDSEPLVTISMSLESKTDPKARITLQSSVAMRLYYLHAPA